MSISTGVSILLAPLNYRSSKSQEVTKLRRKPVLELILLLLAAIIVNSASVAELTPIRFWSFVALAIASVVILNCRYSNKAIDAMFKRKSEKEARLHEEQFQAELDAQASIQAEKDAEQAAELARQQQEEARVANYEIFLRTANPEDMSLSDKLAVVRQIGEQYPAFTDMAHQIEALVTTCDKCIAVTRQKIDSATLKLFEDGLGDTAELISEALNDIVLQYQIFIIDSIDDEELALLRAKLTEVQHAIETYLKQIKAFQKRAIRKHGERSNSLAGLNGATDRLALSNEVADRLSQQENVFAKGGDRK